MDEEPVFRGIDALRGYVSDEVPTQEMRNDHGGCKLVGRVARQTNCSLSRRLVDSHGSVTSCLVSTFPITGWI